MPSGTENLLTAASFEGYDFEVTRTGKLDGLATPSYAVAESVLAGARGSRFGQALMRKRQITLEFLVFTTSESDYFSQRAAILEACKKDDGEGELTLTVNGTQYLINAVPEPPEISWPHFPYFTVQAQFTAYDPVIYSQTTNSHSAIAVPGGGGATFPLEFPITFTTQNTGTVNVNNSGNIATYPIITLSDLLTSPTITNVTTGEYFQLNETFDVGDSVIINMKERTAVLNGVTSLLTDIVDGSTWWSLNPGTSTVRINTGATSDTGTLAISWRDAYSGI